MCGYMAPALVSTSADLIEYWVNDSDPVDPQAKKGYSERFIHGEVFKMYPGVNCVIHSHAEDVLPYVTGGVPLLPVYHMAGFLGNAGAPVFDIETLYEKGEQQDLLVRNSKFGEGLASKFSRVSREPGKIPDHNVVLMRRHGFTTWGGDVETAVYRAIYTKINAGVQTNAMLTRNAFASALGSTQGLDTKFAFEPLTEAMCDGCDKMNTGTQDKPWRLWVKEVEENRLYVNKG